MGVMRARVVVDVPDDLDALVLGKVNAGIQDAALEIAGEIAADARETTAFRDYTGTSRESEWHKKHFPNATRLRPNIKVRKSKYQDGGAIVYVRGPHAHLVEYGHVLVVHGKVAGTVPAHPFLRPSAQARLDEAVQKFAQAVKEGLGE